MFLVTNGSKWLQYKTFTFSGGEISVKLDPEMTSFLRNALLPFHIHARIYNAEKIMELALLVDAIRRAFGEVEIHLDCPYLPYARQDRVCAPGESLSLKVICDIINSLNFKSVTIADVHSDVALALLNNVKNTPVEDIIGKVVRDINWTHTTVVAPDAGAIKKVLKVAQKFGTPMVRADKIRDVNTGEIKETVAYVDNATNDFLVVDDICDGGKTFIELAKVLSQKTTGKLYLYVTHGIFSKGLDIITDCYDNVYCAYPFPEVPLRGI